MEKHTPENKDRVCDECGLIHSNGISWHGRCYNCGGELIDFNFKDHELTAVTPKGIQIYEKNLVHSDQPKTDKP